MKEIKVIIWWRSPITEQVGHGEKPISESDAKSWIKHLTEVEKDGLEYWLQPVLVENEQSVDS